MISKRFILRASATLALALAGAPTLCADTYTIDWWTTAPSATMSGGGWEVSASVGQPEAGQPMSGGDWTVAGGFWVAPSGPQLRPGDLNCDGIVDFDDINPFILALSDPVAYQAAYPNCTVQNGDCNGDTYVDFDDINPFIVILSGGG